MFIDTSLFEISLEYGIDQQLDRRLYSDKDDNIVVRTSGLKHSISGL